MKYEIYRYDLWGNKNDGYEVNDVMSTGVFVDVRDVDSDITILIKVRRALDKAGRKYPHHGNWALEGLEDLLFIEIDGVPVCALRTV